MASTIPHPVYGNLDYIEPTETLLYAVYKQAASVDLPAVLEELMRHEHAVDLCGPGSREFVDADIDSIVEYHRSIPADGTFDPYTFIVADHPDFQQQGVLLVNVYVVYYDENDQEIPHEGWRVEYMRSSVDTAVGTLVMNTVGYHSWEDMVGSAPFGLQWDRYFACYPNERPHDSFDRVYSAFFSGLNGLKKQRFAAKNVSQGDKILQGTMEQVAEMHRSVAATDPTYHPTLFMVFDEEEWKTRHVLVVNLDFHGRVDTLRLEIRVAADMLASIALGEREWTPSGAGMETSAPAIAGS